MLCDLCRFFILAHDCQPEIGDDGGAIGANHDVCRFEIPMNNALLVSQIECLCQLCYQLDNVLLAEFLTGLNQRCQRFPVDKLHRDVMDVINLVDIIHRTQIRMIQIGSRPGFAVEAGNHLGIGVPVNLREFESHLTFQLRIPSQINTAHAPFTQAGENLVASKLRGELFEVQTRFLDGQAA